MLKVSTDGWIARELGGVSNVKVVNRWMDKPGSWGGGVSNVKVVNRWMDKPGSWGGKQC